MDSLKSKILVNGTLYKDNKVDVSLSERCNFFVKDTILENTDIDNSGNLIPYTGSAISDKIYMDFTRPIYVLDAVYSYIYAYTKDNSYLGNYNTNHRATNVSELYPTVSYIRIFMMPISDKDTLIVSYYNDKSKLMDYNPVGGYIDNYNFINNQKYVFGWFHRHSWLDLDTVNQQIVLHTKTDSSEAKVIMCSDGNYYVSNQIQIVNNQAVIKENITNFNYWMLVYKISTKEFLTLIDVTTGFNDYVILGFFHSGKVYLNVGKFTVDGQIADQTLDELIIRIQYLENSSSGSSSSQINELVTQFNNLQTSLSSEVQNRTAADTALSNRIDNLVIGSSASDTEIVDARTDKNGTVHNTLKTRLDSDYSMYENVVGNILTVGTNKQYQTITAATRAANNGDVILVSRGTYEESIPLFDKVISIIGESREECVIKWPNTEYSQSVIHMWCGVLKNVTLYAYDNGGTPTTTYGRGYCLHCDFYSKYSQYGSAGNYLYIENVKFINDSNEPGGVGLRENFTIEFNNCYFECHTGAEAALYVHSATSTTVHDSKFILRNCTLINNSNTIGTMKLEAYYVHIKGCKVLFQNNIVVNNGGGTLFWMKKTPYGSQTASNYMEVPDWELDVASANNTDSNMNYIS